MRGKATGAALLAAAVLLLGYAAYAVLISLSSANIAQLGGTGMVDVNCPASPCQVDRVTWTLSGTPPRVTTVHVTWTPASAGTASYTVYVVLYDSSNNVVGSGSETQPGSSTPVTTNVPVSNIDPRDVYRVEVVIVQTAF